LGGFFISKACLNGLEKLEIERERHVFNKGCFSIKSDGLARGRLTILLVQVI
jgi:hypothetical protein